MGSDPGCSLYCGLAETKIAAIVASMRARRSEETGERAAGIHGCIDRSASRVAHPSEGIDDAGKRGSSRIESKSLSPRASSTKAG